MLEKLTGSSLHLNSAGKLIVGQINGGQCSGGNQGVGHGTRKHVGGQVEETKRGHMGYVGGNVARKVVPLKLENLQKRKLGDLAGEVVVRD